MSETTTTTTPQSQQPPVDSSSVSIRVRGQRFIIPASELEKPQYQNTLFFELLQTTKTTDTETGSPRLFDYPDRDPEFVGVLITFLRKGRFFVRFNELNSAQKQNLVDDIVFFRVPGLEHILEEYEKEKATAAATTTTTTSTVEVGAEPLTRADVHATDTLLQNVGTQDVCAHCGVMGSHTSDACPYMQK